MTHQPTVEQPFEAQLVYDKAALTEECQALGIWEAVKAVRELAFIVSQSREAHARIVEMRDGGSDFFDIEVDRAATRAAGEGAVVYKPSDRLLGFLAANRADHGHPDDTE